MSTLVGKWWSAIAFALAVATVASVSIATVAPRGPAADRIGFAVR